MEWERRPEEEESAEENSSPTKPGSRQGLGYPPPDFRIATEGCAAGYEKRDAGKAPEEEGRTKEGSSAYGTWAS